MKVTRIVYSKGRKFPTTLLPSAPRSGSGTVASAGARAYLAKINPPMRVTTEVMCIQRIGTASTARNVGSIIRVYDYDSRDPASRHAAVQLFHLWRRAKPRGRSDRSGG